MVYVSSELLKALDGERLLTRAEIINLNELIKVPLTTENIETCFQAVGAIALATGGLPTWSSQKEPAHSCRILAASMCTQGYDILMKMIRIWFSRNAELNLMTAKLLSSSDIAHVNKALFIYGFCYMSVMCGINCENQAERVMGQVREFIHNIYKEVVEDNE